MTKMNDIRKMKDTELAKLVSDKREELRSVRFGTAGKDVRAARANRKEVARALTELKARQTSTSVETK